MGEYSHVSAEFDSVRTLTDIALSLQNTRTSYGPLGFIGLANDQSLHVYLIQPSRLFPWSWKTMEVVGKVLTMTRKALKVDGWKKC